MEAVSLTCDDTTSACPGTELTCICSVDTVGLLWHLPRGGGDIPLTCSLGIGYTNTAGIFTAEIIDTPPEGIVPLLIIRYNATQILVNKDIVCSDGTVTTNTTGNHWICK